MRRMIEKNIIYQIWEYRMKGHSIPEISGKFHISKSTASRYGMRVKILPKYYQRWLDRRNASKVISQRNWELAALRATEKIGTIYRQDLALIGASLYWAEGAKKDLSFCNSDPNMIRVFIHILKEIYQIPISRIKITLRIYEDLDRKLCLNYWSNIAGIRLDESTSVNVLKGSKKGKLSYGMCRVRVSKGGLLLKEFSSVVQQINNSIMSPHSSMDRTRDS